MNNFTFFFAYLESKPNQRFFFASSYASHIAPAAFLVGVVPFASITANLISSLFLPEFASLMKTICAF